MKYFFFILFYFHYLHASTSLETKNTEGFSFKTEFSNLALSLFEEEDLHLEFIYPSDYQLDVQSIKDDLLVPYGFTPFPFEILYEHVFPPEKVADGKAKQEIIIKLKPRMLGTFTLTFHSFIFNSNSSNKKISINIPAQSITLSVTLPSEFIPIVHYKPRILNFFDTLPVDISGKAKALQLIENQNKLINSDAFIVLLKHKSIPWIGLVILGICLAGILACIFYPNRIKKSLIKAPSLNPEEKALKKLKDLTKLNLPSQNKFMEFYVQLKRIVDEFLETTYPLQISTKATEELKLDLEYKKIMSDSHISWINEWIHKVDLIKYGKYPITLEQCLEDLEKVKQFIKISYNPS